MRAILIWNDRRQQGFSPATAFIAAATGRLNIVPPDQAPPLLRQLGVPPQDLRFALLADGAVAFAPEAVRLSPGEDGGARGGAEAELLGTRVLGGRLLQRVHCLGIELLLYPPADWPTSTRLRAHAASREDQ